MFHIGDHVTITVHAAEDLCAATQDHLPISGVIVAHGPVTQHDAPEAERLYVIETPEEIPGGHNCQGKAKARRGLYVTAKHLQLTDPVTVPNIAEFVEHSHL